MRVDQFVIQEGLISTAARAIADHGVADHFFISMTRDGIGRGAWHVKLTPASNSSTTPEELESLINVALLALAAASISATVRYSQLRQNGATVAMIPHIILG